MSKLNYSEIKILIGLIQINYNKIRKAPEKSRSLPKSSIGSIKHKHLINKIPNVVITAPQISDYSHY